MSPAVAALLNQIDEFLAARASAYRSIAETREAWELWNVLSALRGPDNDDDDLKKRTTTVIRSAALPKTAKVAAEVGSIAIFAQPGERLDASNIPEDLAHFGWHIESAAGILGLR